MTCMISDITNELDDLAKSFKLYRFRTELDFYQSQDDNIYADRINSLTNIIINLENISKEKNNSKNKIRNAFDEIDKLVYKKPWKKIPNFHKDIKIKEYLLERFKDDNDQIEHIEKIIIDAIGNSEIKKDFIVYDQNLCKITDITVLKQNIEGKYILEFPKENN